MSGFAVAELIDGYWKHVQSYYAVPSGHTGEIGSYRIALRLVNDLYGPTRVADFGPLSLKAVRDRMVADGWARTYVNRQMGRVRRMFKWGVENELVSAAVFQALTAVEGLRAGKTKAVESEPVRPVSDEVVDATLPHVSPQVAAVIQLQRLTGMRPGEVAQMRPGDLDRRHATWEYRPAHHKAEHHGHRRTVYLGQRCQELLLPFLDRAATRRTPMSSGNRPGTNRVRRRRQAPGARFTTDSYRRAIEHGCDRAFPPPGLLAPRPGESKVRWMGRLTDGQRLDLARWRSDHRWHPHQLRHSAATQFRREYGAEATQVLLGHKNLRVTELYAEKDVERARSNMGEIG